jgi:alcohol dehydrogenase (cytochrome c)
MTRLQEPEQYVGPRRRATRRIPVGVLVALGALALIAAALYAYAQPPPSSPATAVPSAQTSSGAARASAAPARSAPASIAPPKDGWPTNGGNWYNQRYSPLKAIDRGNVAQLKGVWRARLEGSGIGTQYSGEGQPIVADGVIYMSTGANDVFAIDVDTGTTLWSYKANLDAKITTVCCSWANRGVAIGDGKVFQGQLDGKIVALDRKTGAVVWSIQAERWQEGYTVVSAPLYYDGMLISGFTGAERGVRGRVKAFDAKTGALRWTFYTIPGRGERGNDTWPQDNELWQDGGGTVWQTPAVDPNLGLLYFSTANAGPDFNGAVRAGDNLFTSSIVALDVKTGAYKWHYQQVHHDLWDYDSGNPVILFDLPYNGVLRRAIAEASKTGFVYVLDRVSGQPLIGIDEQPVAQEPRQKTSPTQPVPRGDAFVPQSIDVAPEGTPLVNGGKIFTPYWTDYVLAKPGITGGTNWPPSSYDPTTGYFYLCASDRASVFRAWEITADRPEEGSEFIGGNFGSHPIPALGVFAALDMHTNKLVFQQQWSESCYSGSVVTAGGLVFVGRSDGRLTALDSSNGAKLWEFQTGAGMNSTASVFEHKGKQYVVAYSAGSVFARSAKGDSVWLFALDGTLGPVPPGN